MEFNKATLKDIRNDLNEVLSKYGIENNIQFRMGTISFDSTSFSCKLQAFASKDGEDVENARYKKFEEDFNRWSKFQDVNENIKVGSTVSHKGDTFQVIGLDLKQRKNKVVLKNVKNNKYVKCSIEALNRFFQ